MKKEDNIEIAKKSLRAERQRIEAQVRKLQEDVSAIKRAEDILSATEPHQMSLSDIELTKSGLYNFSKLAPTEAILKVLEDRPDKWWEPLSITEEIKKGGLKTKARNLHNITSATLIRLVREGKLERQQLDGKRKSKYRIKQT